MKPGTTISFLFFLYNLVWALIIPMLKWKARIKDGYEQRMGHGLPRGPVDIWVQSASAGEAYLTAEIVSHLDPELSLNIWLTANTRQGLDILSSERDKRKSTHPGLRIHVSFAPFDKPSLMDGVVKMVNPRLMVLVELEVWPGLLKSLKKNNCAVLVVNGRLTEKSLSRYLIMPSLWEYLAPDEICAISDDDAFRFSQLFPSSTVSMVPNIKFDRFSQPSEADSENPLSHLFENKSPLVVLGSVRQEEEDDVEQLIQTLVSRNQDLVVLLFPRHMHRINFWADRLGDLGIAYQKRSELPGMDDACRVVVWDCFGELGHAYALASAAFVGGSLAPLGGQNFLEVLTCGIVPVCGPSWENFAWVGQDILAHGLLQIEHSGKNVAERLLAQIKSPIPKEYVRQKALDYFEQNRGGTLKSCEKILCLLNPLSQQGHS